MVILARSEFFFTKNFSVLVKGGACARRLNLNSKVSSSSYTNSSIKGLNLLKGKLFGSNTNITIKTINNDNGMHIKNGSQIRRQFSTGFISSKYNNYSPSALIRRESLRRFSTIGTLLNKPASPLSDGSKNSRVSFSETADSLNKSKSEHINPSPEIKFESKSKSEAESENKKEKKEKAVISPPIVGYWLMATSTLIFFIVVLGGLTRLTESGLSITEWKPVIGALPPSTEEDWEIEFNKYKLSPEFKQLNSHMSLEDFKFIFFMEWSHRLVGRMIGLFFVLPGLYFVSTKKVSLHVSRRLGLLTLLFGLQGVIGWWMVYSGLDPKQLAERRSKPTVSPYRLTTHLGAAFVLYAGMVWTGLEISREARWLKKPSSALKQFSLLHNPRLKPFRLACNALCFLVFCTAMAGGFVAGLDAGLIYNEFPKMGEGYIPPKIELLNPYFSRKEDLSDLWWRNLFENPTTVQFIHRTLAITTFFSVFALHMYATKNKHIIPKTAVKATHVAMGFVTLQMALGISTLIYLIPIPLASAHQAGSLALLTSALVLASRLRTPRPFIQQICKKTSTKIDQSKILKNLSELKSKRLASKDITEKSSSTTSTTATETVNNAINKNNETLIKGVEQTKQSIIP